MPNPENPYDREHLDSIAYYTRMLNAIYSEAVNEAARLGASQRESFDPARPFSFADFPRTRARVDELVDRARSGVLATVTTGISAEWARANAKNDALVRQIFGDVAEDRLSAERRERYFGANRDVLKAFMQRREAGMDLSQRVWKRMEPFKSELEDGIDAGLRDGLSAAEISRLIRRYLNNPAMRFRRVRDDHGNLVLSKRAAEYHPGNGKPGVYRSSYKNAVRLTATETNMAYRTADHERWRKMDFVVGIEIHLSNNHTLNGKPFADICDDLAGRYPKDFKFTGWHPQCRCFATSILKTEEEMDEDRRRILSGEEPTRPEDSENWVEGTPENFNEWIEENQERIAKAEANGTLPYFIRDNRTLVDGILNADAAATAAAKPTALVIAAQRHAARTEEQIQAIKDAWNDRKADYKKIIDAANAVITDAKEYGVDSVAVQAALTKYNLASVKTLTAEARAAVDAVIQQENALADLIPDVHEWHKQFTIEQLQGVYSAVEAKLKQWSGLSLEELKKRLNFEANEYLGKNMNGVQQKYSTWQVSQAAYQKQLASVEYKIAMQSIESEMAGISQWSAANKKYTKIAKLLSDYEQAVATGEDIAVIRQKADLVRAEYDVKTAAKSVKFGDEAFTAERKNAALWDLNGGAKADKALFDTASNAWKGATEDQKDEMYGYTRHFAHINEPLQGRTYYGSQSRAAFEKSVKNIETYIDKNELKCDMWFQRGDKDLSAIAGRINFAGNTMPKDIYDLKGMEMQEGGFMSAGSAKGKGFATEPVIINIYAPKGSKVAYCEPFSYYGKGGARNWDGDTRYSVFSSEFESLFQRGTVMRITKVERAGNKIYIDCEVVRQGLKDLKYVKDSWIGY